jgi:hypothetical protein
MTWEGDMSANHLSVWEREELIRCEAVIGRDLNDFMAKGDALREVRDHKLYREQYGTFEQYLSCRWGWTRQRAYQVISSAIVAHELMTADKDSEDAKDGIEMSNNVLHSIDQEGKSREDGIEMSNNVLQTSMQAPSRVKPTNGRQVAPLSALPADQRGEAWDEATRRSGGKVPTTAKVKEVVNEKAKLSRVNNQESHDPPDVAMARRKGRIPKDAVVLISDPGEPCDAVQQVREEIAEREAIKADVPDEEWVQALPLHSKLTGTCLKIFMADALSWRHLTDIRTKYIYHSTREYNKAKCKGPYLKGLRFHLAADPPEKWLICPTIENGGCGGIGQIPLIGDCPKCHGAGYWMNRRS